MSKVREKHRRAMERAVRRILGDRKGRDVSINYQTYWWVGTAHVKLRLPEARKQFGISDTLRRWRERDKVALNGGLLP